MKHAFSLLCLASAAASINAANIAWVTYHGTDAGTAAGSVVTGFAPDKPYTDLLTSAGHTVTRVVRQDNAPAALISQLNTFDLVIIGRSVPSGDFTTDAETAAYNTGVTRPMILTGGYILRGGDATTPGNNRLGYTTGSSMPDTVGNVQITINEPGHPIFAGLTLGPGNTLDYATAVTGSANAVLQRGISVNANNIFSTGTLLAQGPVAAVGAEVNGRMMIGEWDAGELLNTAVATGPQDVTGGRRLVLLTGTREASGASTETSGVYDLTADGAQVFVNAVAYMVPEPASGTLLGFGAAALLLRRRKA